MQMDASIEKNCKSFIFYNIIYIQLFVVIALFILIVFTLFFYIFSISPILALVYTFLILLAGTLFVNFDEKLGKYIYNLIQKYPESQIGENRHAIIIVHKRLPKKMDYSPSEYSEGIDILINRFRNSSKPQKYKVYDIFSKQDFKETIENCNPSHI